MPKPTKPTFKAAFDGKIKPIKTFFDKVKQAMVAVKEAAPPAYKNKIISEFNEVVRASSDRVQTMLYIAARFGHFDIVEAFVAFTKEMVEQQLLMNGDLSTQDEVSKFFVKRVVDAQNGDRSTALHGACYGGHHKIVAFLVANGADTTIVNSKEETPLNNATEPADGVSDADKQKTISAVKGEVVHDEEPAKGGGEEPVRKAKKTAQQATAQATPLPPPAPAAASVATANGYPEHKHIAPTPNKNAKGNLCRGSMIDAYVGNGSNDKLVEACKDRAKVQALLPQMNDEDKLQLLLIISTRNLGKLKLNAKEKAVELPAIVEMVLQSGFDINNTTCDAESHPINLNWDSPNVLTHLLQHGIRYPGDKCNDLSLVHLSCLFDFPENLITYMNFFNLSTDDKLTYSQTPLTYAVRVNSHKCAKALLARGADVNRFVDGQNAMMQAVRQYDKWSNKKEQLVQMLVDAGADTNFTVPNEYLDTSIVGKNIRDVIRPKNATVLAILQKGKQ